MWWTPLETACLLTKVWRRPSLAAPSTTSWLTLNSASRTQSLRSRWLMRTRARMTPPPNETPSPSHRCWPNCPEFRQPRPHPATTTPLWTTFPRCIKTPPSLVLSRPTQQGCRPVLAAPYTAWRPHCEALPPDMTTLVTVVCSSVFVMESSGTTENRGRKNILKTDLYDWFSSGVHLLVFRIQEVESRCVCCGSHRLVPSFLMFSSFSLMNCAVTV